jgi:hypothetical protein
MRLWLLAAAVACAVPQGALAQDAGLNLKGAIDFHVHQAPDSVQRAIDADDCPESRGWRD